MTDQNEDFEQLRETVRDSFFLQATLRRPDRADILARVRNLSSGGMMIETPEILVRGEVVESELRGIGPVAGRVAWATEGRVGVAFDIPINPRLARRPIGSVASAGEAAPKRALRVR